MAFYLIVSHMPRISQARRRNRCELVQAEVGTKGLVYIMSNYKAKLCVNVLFVSFKIKLTCSATASLSSVILANQLSWP